MKNRKKQGSCTLKESERGRGKRRVRLVAPPPMWLCKKPQLVLAPHAHSGYNNISKEVCQMLIYMRANRKETEEIGNGERAPFVSQKGK